MKDPVRTDMHCHQCSNAFIATLDVGLDGNHVVECPYCSHEHCRVIEKGVVTKERWDHRHQRVNVEKRSTWKPDSRPVYTTTAAEFLRARWIDRSDIQR